VFLPFYYLIICNYLIFIFGKFSTQFSKFLYLLEEASNDMKYFLVLSLFWFSPFVSAQKLMVGPMLGGRVSNPVYDDKTYSDEYRTHWMPGFQAGIASIWQVSNLFTLANDLYYAQEGKKITGDGGLTKFREYHQLIGLPIIFRVNFGNDRFMYYGGVGPNIRYWLKSNGTANVPELIEITGSDEPLNYTIQFKGYGESDEVFFVSAPNRLQLGIDINAGVMLPLHQQWLTIDLRYGWGHTNFAKSESTYTPFVFFDDNLAHTQHSVQVSCAYLFSFDLFEITHKGKSTKKVK
jgi:hypothetical protein